MTEDLWPLCIVKSSIFLKHEITISGRCKWCGISLLERIKRK